ncbi:penicillin-binding protein 2 [Dyella sp. M7H15-1]|uniref:peptidoglycan D,D-transpeptidase FtsI family protein n=1 Tax=Dyella sp. M7H15-1 TaxID=2501295 RepID=UPI0010051AEC|nr:penicillin-binding protein 2 [Dyella sp. M7H15-1]QAU24101.1 penicillin-binding protein 2 [Dyella sp. M7H15-1]
MNWLPRPSAKPAARRQGMGPSARRRMLLVVGILGAASLGLVARAFDLQVVRKQFYQNQGDARFLRVVPIAVSRGTIFDRNGEPLAVSTPMVSITVVPSEVLDNTDRIPTLAQALGTHPDDLKNYLEQRADREFAYLRRQMSPDAAQAVLDLGVPGVNGQREYKRYYPSGEVTAHVLGFTNIDDHGQEGLELAFDSWLAGKPGAKRVIRDRMGHIVEDVEQVRAPQPGQNLTLSIDRRIQFLAYSELKKQLEDLSADSGEMVILDVHTGEILAMVSLPTYNPNAVTGSAPAQRRNRAVTDVVEPGSTMKPFTMAAGLSSGKYTPTAPMIDTGNGHWYFMGKDIRDVESGGNGVLTPTGVLTKSSNIGAAKIALSLDSKFLYDTYRAFGYGESTSSGFPGESAGFLKTSRGWRPIEKATMGYGYGLNVTPLQLAVAYGTLADNGIRHTPTFIKGGADAGMQIISPVIARELVNMLETVTAPGGSATRAQIANYIVAGKTGTAHLVLGGGYAKNNYNSLFAGIVPATDPRLVGVVVINNPKSSIYYGGLVSAPVFQRVMTGALRLLDVPPDNIGRWYAGGPLQAGGGLAGTAPAQNTPDDRSTVEAVDP